VKNSQGKNVFLRVDEFLKITILGAKGQTAHGGSSQRSWLVSIPGDLSGGYHFSMFRIHHTLSATVPDKEQVIASAMIDGFPSAAASGTDAFFHLV
jgi:hypothetical protein